MRDGEDVWYEWYEVDVVQFAYNNDDDNHNDNDEKCDDGRGL